MSRSQEQDDIEEMAQQLGALAAPLEGPNLVPSSFIRQLQPPHSLAPGDPIYISGLQGHVHSYGMHSYRHTHTHVNENKYFLKA